MAMLAGSLPALALGMLDMANILAESAAVAVVDTAKQAAVVDFGLLLAVALAGLLALALVY